MDINRNNMNELFTSFNMLFAKGLANAPHEYEKYSTIITSSTASTVYPYLEQFGRMREWIGDRQKRNIASGKIEVFNRDFEDTVVVPRNDIEDDQYALYGTLIQMLGQNAAQLWGDLAVEALLGGDEKKWADELPFFNAGRKYGEDSVINNLGTAALSAESYAEARCAMLSYRGHDGKALRVHPSLLIVGPSNEGRANDILKASSRLVASTVANGENTEIISGSIQNTWAGTARILIEPDLGSEWFLADTTGPLKPVVVQKRKEVKLTRMDHETDDNVFMAKEYIYGTDARGEAFLSFPHLIYGAFPA